MALAPIRDCVVRREAGHGPSRWCVDVAGRPALFWLLRELSRFGIERAHMLGAWTDDDLDRAVQHLPRPVELRAAPALPAAAARDGRFLLCERPCLFDANVAALLGDTAPLAAVVVADGTGRVLLRPSDRDRFRCGSDATPVSRVVTAGWSVDLGTEAGLAAARAALPARLRRPALFLDRDGTINVDHGYVGTRERFAWIDGAREAIASATAAGWHVFIVTNQSGVARGLYDEAAVMALHDWMGQEVRAAGGTIDDVRYCPDHPEAALPRYRAASDWRKPAPGMILDLIQAWEVDMSRSLLVGDQPSDVAAARAARIAGHLFPGGRLDTFVADLLAAARPAASLPKPA